MHPFELDFVSIFHSFNGVEWVDQSEIYFVCLVPIYYESEIFTNKLHATPEATVMV
jgi:hypothetical protein